MDANELKAAMIERLREMAIPPGVAELDPRLYEYICHVRDYCEGEDDVHNVDEVAACCRFLRLWNCYPKAVARFRRFVRLMERFTFDTMDGTRAVKMSMSQVFISAGIYLFATDADAARSVPTMTDADTSCRVPTTPNADAARSVPTKMDAGRRLTTLAIVFIPRKYGKTWFVGGIAVEDFLFGDNDGEVHIVSNSLEQSKIAFKATKHMLQQLDPKGAEIRFTANTMNWKAANTTGRRASVDAHTAGGKTKDGAKASVVVADEYGSAAYVKDHCDMSDAINVYRSSMGPRANPLTVITTTAGRVVEGPFETQMRTMQKVLYNELNLGTHERDKNDNQFLFALHPDEWEYTDEHFGTERLWRKVNPHIGITIQEDYYANAWRDAQGDPEAYKETVTKLFNRFVSNSSRPWIEAGDLRPLQTKHRITDLNKQQWVCFACMDFSKGNDLCSISYVAVNTHTKEKFWDCSAWISENTLHSNPNAALYRQWIEQGYLYVCPGSTIDERMVMDEINRVSEHVNFVQFGYDPFDSKTYVNNIQAWIVSRVQGRYFGSTLERYLKYVLQPVSQTFGSYNCACQMVYDDVFARERCVHLSSSPILPWAFGNAVLQESSDGQGNIKPVKRTANAKVDPCQCICMGYILIGKLVPFKP